mmetsp:Transcript_119940/g.187325  ORF Transcript_119940/g.187325 Transcript_119940/m.187325 type:complete len:177 (-) Transcript_119940:86-616(-)
MVKVAHVLALSISACLGRCLQIDEEHVNIENPVDSLRMLLTAMNSEFKWHQPTRHYLVARAPLCSRSLGRLRGGATGVIGTLGKLVTGKSRKKPVVVDKESFLGGLFSFDDYAVNCRNWWQTGDPRHLFRRKWMKVGALSLDLLLVPTLSFPLYTFNVMCMPQQEEPFWKKPFGLR